MRPRGLLGKYGQLLVVLAAFSIAVLLRHLRDQGSATALAQRVSEPVPAYSSPYVPIPEPGQSPAPSPTPPATATVAPESPPTPVLPTATPTAVPAVVPPTATPPVATPTPRPPEPAASATTVTLVRLVRKAPTYFDNVTFRDGTFTGKAIYTQYGTMQVQLAMKDGRIVEVVPVEEPRGTSRSSQIADELIPAWVAEAIEAQDWDVDGVSGATITWQAFKKAMVYALRAAE
jgi:uncharacterized protein with FMN-binding domain